MSTSSSASFFHPPPLEVLAGPASPVHRQPFHSILPPKKPNEQTKRKQNQSRTQVQFRDKLLHSSNSDQSSVSSSHLNEFSLPLSIEAGYFQSSLNQQKQEKNSSAHQLTLVSAANDKSEEKKQLEQQSDQSDLIHSAPAVSLQSQTLTRFNEFQSESLSSSHPLWHRIPYSPPLQPRSAAPQRLSIDQLKRKKKFLSIGHGKFITLENSIDNQTNKQLQMKIPQIPLLKFNSQIQEITQSEREINRTKSELSAVPSSHRVSFRDYMAECRAKRANSNHSTNQTQIHSQASSSTRFSSTAPYRVSTPDDYHWNDENLCPLYSLPAPLEKKIQKFRKNKLILPKHVAPTVEGLEEAIKELAEEKTEEIKRKGGNKSLPSLDKNELTQQRWFNRPLTCFIDRPAGVPSDRHQPRLYASDRELSHAVNGVQIFPDSSFLRLGHFDTSFQLDYVPYEPSAVYRANPELRHRVHHRVIQGDKRDIEQKIIRKLAGIDLQSRHSGFK
jgi:hypothetical protein